MPHLFLIRPGTLFHQQQNYHRHNIASSVPQITAIPSPHMHCQNTAGHLIVGVHSSHSGQSSARQNLPSTGQISPGPGYLDMAELPSPWLTHFPGVFVSPATLVIKTDNSNGKEPLTLFYFSIRPSQANNYLPLGSFGASGASLTGLDLAWSALPKPIMPGAPRTACCACW